MLIPFNRATTLPLHNKTMQQTFNVFASKFMKKTSNYDIWTPWSTFFAIYYASGVLRQNVYGLRIGVIWSKYAVYLTANVLGQATVLLINLSEGSRSGSKAVKLNTVHFYVRHCRPQVSLQSSQSREWVQVVTGSVKRSNCSYNISPTCVHIWRRISLVRGKRGRLPPLQ